jgi:hypothetical protein
MTITVGSFVRVPKGTMVWPNDSVEPGKLSTRDQVVEVRAIVAVEDLTRGQLSWLYLLPEKDQVDPHKAARYGLKSTDSNYLIWSTRYDHDQLRSDPALCKRLRDKLEQQMGTTDFTLVEWSTKRALLAHVRAEAPPQKKERVITVKQKMVKGSRWRITEDAQLEAIKDNPRYMPAVDAFWKQHPNPQRSHLKPGNGTFTDLNTYLEHHGITQYVSYVYATVKAGQEFRVQGKMRNSYPDNGHLVPVRFADDAKDSTLTFNSIKDRVQELEVPVVRVFVLRNRDTGETFSEWSDNWHRETAKAVMSTDWRKMRKFDDMSRLKQFVLEFSGYYKDMNVRDNREYWQEPSQVKIMDLPANWEAVACDKMLKTDIESVDLQAWYAQAWRLRTLTMSFGSPVRALYKTIENKGELDKYKGMLVIRMPLVNHTYGGPQYEDGMSPEDEAAMADLVDNLGLRRGEFRKAKDHHGIAIAFANASVALMAKLKYQGNLRLNVINLDKMQEQLEPQSEH